MKWIIIVFIMTMLLFGVVLALNIDETPRVVRESFVGDIFGVNKEVNLDSSNIVQRIRTSSSETIIYSNGTAVYNQGGGYYFIEDENGEYKELLEVVNFSLTNDDKYNIKYLDKDFNVSFKAEDKNKKKNLTFAELKDKDKIAKIENIIDKQELKYAKWGVNISNFDETKSKDIDSFYYELEGDTYAETPTRIYLTDKVFLDFSDLEERGFTYEIKNKKVKIGNVTGKTNIDLDPTLSLTDGTGILADANVQSGSANSNFGTQVDLEVKGAGTGGTRRAYIKFEIANLPYSDGSATIDNVTLNLTVDSQSSSSAETHYVHEVYYNASWDESTITWNNQPCGTTADVLTSTYCNNTRWSQATTSSGSPDYDVIWDLTSGFQNFMNNKADNLSEVSLVVRDFTETTSDTTKRYSSKEDTDTSQRPRLTIVYTIDNLDVNNLVFNSTAGLNETDENLTVYATNSNVSQFLYDFSINGTRFTALHYPFDIRTDAGNTSSFGYTDLDAYEQNSNVTFERNGGCILGACYNFTGSGSDGYLTFPWATADRPTTNITASAWIKTKDNGTVQYVIGNVNGGTSGFSQFREFGINVQNDGKIRVAVPDGGAFAFVHTVTSNNSITENEWHHVALTYSNSTGDIKVFIDGQLENTNNLATPQGLNQWGETDVHIGANWDGVSNDVIEEFNGSIDEVMIFNRTLSDEQINAMYVDGLDGSKPKTIASAETTTGELWQVNVTGLSIPDRTTGTTSTSNSILILADTGATDTCTYTSGNWEIDCSDNCVISSNVDVGGNNISINGTGTFVTSANITNYNKIHIQGTDSTNICRVTCISGGCFKE